MQMFSNAITNRLRTLGAVDWGHIDDYAIAHDDCNALKEIMHTVLSDLVSAHVRVNWTKSILYSPVGCA